MPPADPRMLYPQPNNAYPYAPYPQSPVAYPYVPYPAPPAKHDWPTPSGRAIPVIWTTVLIILTISAIGFALAGGFLTPTLTPTLGHVVYQSTLAKDDGQWLMDSQVGACAFENGGLHATIAVRDDIAPSCRFNQSFSDVRVSVTILPSIILTAPLHPLIMLHGSIAFLFGSDGAFTVIDTKSTTQAFIVTFASSWHTAGIQANTIIVDVSGSVYTLAVNGVQVFQQTFADADSSGAIALGAHSFQITAGDPPASGEAIFTDCVISTP